MKVKLFTHVDLDAVGCEVVAKVFYGRENVDVEYHTHETLKGSLKNFIGRKEYQNYDKILMADMSFTDDFYKELKKIFPHDVWEDKFKLIDHHTTALELNKYDFANVIVEENGIKECGASLLYKYIVEDMGYEIKKSDKVQELLTIFVKAVRKYDVWEFKEGDISENLETLRILYGNEKFVENFYSKIIDMKNYSDIPMNYLCYDILINEHDNIIIEQKQEEKNRYLNKKLEDISFFILNGCKFVVSFAELYRSELGNYLCNKVQEDIVGAMIINVQSGGISLRTNKDYVDLGKLAKSYGAGGHQKASGVSISKLMKQNEDFKEFMINRLLTKQ